ncbi:MAG: PKD domain-containing protein, partial [Flavobacteriales bacterium]
FKANTTVSCNGIVNFTDLTPNKVTSWLWEFGDGDTSHKQNPTHTYVSGTYTVKLTATNTFGSKAESKTNYITVNLGSGTISAQCTPVSSSSAGFGITSFSFSSLANTSQDATVGYE